MAEYFYNKFVTNRKRIKRRTICIFPIFNCLQNRSEIRFLRHPTHFQKGLKTQKRRLQLKFATDFIQISHKAASPCGTHVVIFSKPPKNILPAFLFLLQLYPVSLMSTQEGETSNLRNTFMFFIFFSDAQLRICIIFVPKIISIISATHKKNSVS